MLGRWTASQIAAASAASLFPRFSREPIGHDELGCDQPDGVAGSDEQPCPVMSTRAGFHADRARRQSGDEFMQSGARHRRANELGAAELIDPVHCKYGLGEIDPDVDNGHGFPLPSELMRFETPSWHLVADCRDSARLSRDGEVPFIR